MMKRVTAVLLLTGLVPLSAADWTAFRGPNGNGISTADNVPVRWGTDQNVAWKVNVPGKSNGSPVVSGDRIFLTSAENDGKERHLHCFATADGSEVWRKTVAYPEKMPTHKTNLYAGTTPATNGERVVVWHGSAGLFCYDTDGNEKWRRELGTFRHQWGYGTSPVLHGETVILHSGPGQEVFVAAFSLNDGKKIWQTDEPVENDGERNNANKYMGSWSTPVLVTADDKTLAVSSMSTRTNAYDIATGNIVWSCDGVRGPKGDLAYASPVIANDICVAMGGFQGPSYGFRMGGRGQITVDNKLWREEKNPQRIGSGVFVNGHIFMANAGPNILQCIDPATGELKWQERASGAYWGSIVSADGRLYAMDQNGTTVVFEPNAEEFKELAVNRLNDAGNSTPAVVDGAIYIRTFRHLYRIGNR